MTTGRLYIVSTPIGNLGDVSYRAIEVLSQANLIVAEDTRKSSILLAHYQVQTPVISFHSYNQVKKTPTLLNRLAQGENIAVISDAGTPGISDPAFYLVSRAIGAGIRIEAIPGASAFLTALVISGLPIHRFVFEGFLPVKKGRRTRLQYLAEEERTMVLYESPHRLLRTLQELLAVMGNRRIVIARELTKKFEEVERLTIQEVILEYLNRSVKGEFVFLIEVKSKI